MSQAVSRPMMSFEIKKKSLFSSIKCHTCHNIMKQDWAELSLYSLFNSKLIDGFTKA